MALITDYGALYKTQLGVNAELKIKHANLVHENRKLKERIYNLERDAAHADAHNAEAYHYEI